MLEVRGMRFESIAACAAHFGVSKNHVRLFMNRGRLDRLGIRKPGGGRRPDPEGRMRVVVRGQEYRDVYECAAALGVKVGTVYAALSEGRMDGLGLGAGPKPGTPNLARSHPIEIGPFKFPSMRAASIALGFSPTYVERARKGEKYYHWERVMAAALRLAAEKESESAERARRTDARRARKS